MLVNLKEILKIAEQDKSAIGMFNATGFDSLQAVIGAAEELRKSGKSVMMQKCGVIGVRYRQRMKLGKGGLVILETND